MPSLELNRAQVEFRLEPDLSVEEFVGILQRSTLSTRRPVSDLQALSGMLQHADIVLTARASGALVGIARALTDWSYCTYLADLAVDIAFQGQGLGRALLTRTHEAAGRHTTLILLAAPQASTYYPHVGLEQHPSCWIQRSNRNAE